MKFMKVLMVGIVSMMTITLAQAQNTPAPSEDRVLKIQERVDQRLEKMTTDLNLTAEQQVALKEVLMDAANDRRMQSDARRAKREVQHNKIKSILTEEQYAKFKENHKEKRKHRKHKRKDKQKDQ